MAFCLKRDTTYLGGSEEGNGTFVDLLRIPIKRGSSYRDPTVNLEPQTYSGQGDKSSEKKTIPRLKAPDTKIRFGFECYYFGESQVKGH